MLPRINTTSGLKLPSPTYQKIFPEFNIQEKTIDLALLIIGLDKRSYDSLSLDDLMHFRVTTQEQKIALDILLFYKSN